MNKKEIKREIKIKTNYLLTNLNKMSMKKVYLILAAAVGMTITSCTTNDYLGDVNNDQAINDGSIQFGLKMQNMTRADIVGSGAADLLGNGFYVVGTKGTEGAKNPSEKLVFDNYLVHYGINTAGTTESNTANWEYVGVTPGTDPYENWVKLSSLNSQTIKYWDYSETQYDFLAFSTGKKKAVAKTAFTGTTDVAVQDDEIGVTKMAYGEGLKNGATAYTFYIPTAEALKSSYITDVVTVANANYGNEVKLTFKNLGSKIRLALYETVPGYSVRDVKFYAVDGTSTDLGTATKYDEGYLISADETNGFYTKGTVTVSFPNVGTDAASNANYKKASVTVVPVTPDPLEVVKTQTFGELNNFQGKEGSEADVTEYIGRNINQATFAGKPEVDYYQVVFPVTAGSALTLRVDYTLVSTDGSGETINVYGAKAVVPATYTSWQPNYAYTYIFKISDNTNGWTNTYATKAGLFPITFDAVVAEIKEVSGEQRTVTTVATPSITTYQQFHDKTKNEYSTKVTNQKSESVVKDIYVQVMDNSTTTPALKGDLNGTTTLDDTPTNRSLFFEVTNAVGTTPISEATVMDALQNRTTDLGTDNITGRNGILLTNVDNVDATVTQIVNGVNDAPITKIDSDGDGDLDDIVAGQVAKIGMASIAASGTYAYVYDYSSAKKTTKTFYQPKTMSVGATIPDDTYYITLAKLETIVAKTTGSEEANDAYIYFSKTTDGVKTTYSYYSVDGKTGNLPEGLLKVAKATDLSEGDGSATKVAEGDFVFDIYKRNTGSYAVKVIQIVKVD